MKRIVFLFFLLLCLGCQKESKGDYADFEVIQTIKGMTDYNAPSITVLIQNVGSGAAFNVRCDVIAKSKTSIIDRKLAYFKSGEKIFPNEKASDMVVFTNITTHEAYETLQFDFDWQDVN